MYNFLFLFSLKTLVDIEQLAGILGAFLASLLDTASNTPNFMASSTKKFELYILAPLSSRKNCKNYETLLYSMSCT